MVQVVADNTANDLGVEREIVSLALLSLGTQSDSESARTAPKKISATRRTGEMIRERTGMMVVL